MKPLLRADFRATADRYNHQIAQNRSAGIRGVWIQFRYTRWDQLQSFGALTICEKRVIVLFSCEMTVSERLLEVDTQPERFYKRSLRAKPLQPCKRTEFIDA